MPAIVLAFSGLSVALGTPDSEFSRFILPAIGWPEILFVVVLLAAILIGIGSVIASQIAWFGVNSQRIGLVSRNLLAMLTLGATTMAVVAIATALLANRPLLADRGLGAIVVGALVAAAAFVLIQMVAKWRWHAWDQQEREQFRSTLGPRGGCRSRPMGRDADLVGLALVAFAYVGVAISVSAPAEIALPALGIALACLGLAWLFGAAQDAENYRAGLDPAAVSDLPTK